MSTPLILPLINHFIENNVQTSLMITFETLEITIYKNELPLHRLTNQNARIFIKKSLSPHLLQMEVMDNLVFNFSFLFTIPNSTENHASKMIQLPKPLNKGNLWVDENNLELEFKLDTPNEDLNLLANHFYKGNLDAESRDLTSYNGEAKDGFTQKKP